jgi:hypothetical protein
VVCSPSRRKRAVFRHLCGSRDGAGVVVARTLQCHPAAALPQALAWWRVPRRIPGDTRQPAHPCPPFDPHSARNEQPRAPDDTDSAAPSIIRCARTSRKPRLYCPADGRPGTNWRFLDAKRATTGSHQARSGHVPPPGIASGQPWISHFRPRGAAVVMETSAKRVRAEGRRCFGERYPAGPAAQRHPGPNRLTAINQIRRGASQEIDPPAILACLVRRASRAGHISHDLLIPEYAGR